MGWPGVRPAQLGSALHAVSKGKENTFSWAIDLPVTPLCVPRNAITEVDGRGGRRGARQLLCDTTPSLQPLVFLLPSLCGIFSFSYF